MFNIQIYFIVSVRIVNQNSSRGVEMMTAEGKIFSVAVSQAAKTKEEPNFVYKVILLFKVVMFFSVASDFY